MDEPLPRGDFYVFVSRAEQRPMCDVWYFSLRDRLPEIPIPLAAGDADLVLDLRGVFDAVYDDATYSETLNYRRQPLPPLAAVNADWVAERLAESGHATKDE